MSKFKRFLFLGSISMLLLAGCLFTFSIKAPSAYAYSEPCPPTQSYGSNNGWVQVIQFRLNWYGPGLKKPYGNPFPLATDGSFGQSTKIAVEDMEASGGFSVTGTMNAQGWGYLGFCPPSGTGSGIMCCYGTGTHCPALIGEGNAGDLVQALQQALNNDAYFGDIGKSYGGVNWYPLTLDGNFGSKTKAATQSFQAAAKITQDGVVGSQTWADLMMCY